MELYATWGGGRLDLVCLVGTIFFSSFLDADAARKITLATYHSYSVPESEKQTYSQQRIPAVEMYSNPCICNNLPMHGVVYDITTNSIELTKAASCSATQDFPQNFIEPKVLLPCSQQPATSPYAQQD